MSLFLDKSDSLRKSMSKPSYPFGYGNASERILTILESKENFPIKHILNSIDAETNPLGSTEENMKIKKFFPVTVSVVLQVFKRNTLQYQLEAAANQTLIPRTIVILQNGHYVDVSKIVGFRGSHPEIEVQFIASSKNLRFHGRFHVAYMMNETYVSIWDDDVSPRSQWLDFCVNFSKLHGNGLVGANGRTFVRTAERKMKQTNVTGRQDFVGHTWTLPREFLKYYLNSKRFTLHTGEDIQLSFALQKVGIESWNPPRIGNKRVDEIRTSSDRRVASWSQNQVPRELLFCRLLKVGFKTLQCTNCHDQRTIDKCISRLEKGAHEVEKAAQEKDRRDNSLIVWTATNFTKIRE